MRPVFAVGDRVCAASTARRPAPARPPAAAPAPLSCWRGRIRRRAGIVPSARLGRPTTVGRRDAARRRARRRSTRRSPTSTGVCSRAAPSTRCFAAPSGALARVALGPAAGRRVVLVPGATGSKEDFVLMMPLFAAAGYRVESFDLAGQYESVDAGPVEPRPAAARGTTSGSSSTTSSPCSTTARPRARARLQLRRHARRARAARAARPVREPHAAERPARARARRSAGQAHRADQRVHLAAPGRGAHALGHPQQPQPGAAATARVRARALRAHPPRERRRHHRAHDAHARPARRARRLAGAEARRGRRARPVAARAARGLRARRSARASRCTPPGTARARRRRTSSCATCWRSSRRPSSRRRRHRDADGAPVQAGSGSSPSGFGDSATSASTARPPIRGARRARDGARRGARAAATPATRTDIVWKAMRTRRAESRRSCRTGAPRRPRASARSSHDRHAGPHPPREVEVVVHVGAIAVHDVAELEPRASARIA